VTGTGRSIYVEEETGADRGRHLTPELLGRPESKGIGADG
jgi:hypothetical protein